MTPTKRWCYLAALLMAAGLGTAACPEGTPGKKPMLQDPISPSVTIPDASIKIRNGLSDGGIAFSPDNQFLAYASYGGRDASRHGVALWSLKEKKFVRWFASPVALATVQFTPRGDLLLASDSLGPTLLWDLRSGELLDVLQPPDERGSGRVLAVSPDGTEWVSTHNGIKAAVWNAGTRKATALEVPVEKGVYDPVWSGAYAPDGRRFVTVSRGRLLVWDAKARKPLGECRLDKGTPWSAAYAPDGKSVVTAHGDGYLRRWDSARPALLEEVRAFGTERLNGAASGVRYSPDGKHLIAVGGSAGQGYLCIWDVAAGGKCVAHFMQRGPFGALAVSPDGRWLAVYRLEGEQECLIELYDFARLLRPGAR